MAIVHVAAVIRSMWFGLAIVPSGWRRRASSASLASVVKSRAAHAWRKMEHAPPSASNDTARAVLRALADTSLFDMIDRLPLAILVVEADGRIAFANECAQKRFGYARREMPGMQADALLPGLRVTQDEAAMTLFACRRDRTRFLADVTLSAIQRDKADVDVKGDKPRMLAVVIDRTGHDGLARNRQELAHLTRVSMLGELAASLAHELNQPLTAILSNAQAAQRFMGREPIDLEEMRDIHRDLVADTNRASDILRRIRALVKKGELELAPLSIAGVVGDVARLVHSDAIVRGIDVKLDIDAQLPLVRGDRVQLQQVVLNLLLNAFDATDEHSVERSVLVRAVREGANRVCVSVRDEGHGLDAALAAHLFEPFCTSKRDGLGLGLSISRSIVEMHGGHIWASNNAGRGATFFFTLPTEESAR
jgi:two-component system, LuxR family, sensor kinase FixL